MTMSINGTNGLTFNDASTQNTAATGFGFKNRIINGAMVIDQRNAGASVTATDTTLAGYVVDRWAYRVLSASKLSFQRSTVAPTGFTNSLLATSLSAYTIGTGEFLTLRQPVEGFNAADFGWGAAGAATVTLSFQVRSSLTGTFGGYISNEAANRFYVFSYTINSANTWETKTITITGDTTGTWLTANNTGLMLGFTLASGSTYQGTAGAWGSSVIVAPTGQVNLAGTSGATFYITGVQLEKGSTATSFDYRPYGTELALCQRYYFKNFPNSVSRMLTVSGQCATATQGEVYASFPVTLRTRPTALETSGTAAHYSVFAAGTNSVACTVVPAWNLYTTDTYAMMDITVASGLVGGNTTQLLTSNAAAYLAWSAEL